jgi:hypothetical protein
MVITKDQVLKEVKFFFRHITNNRLNTNQIEVQDDLSVILDTSVTMLEPPPNGKLPIKLHMVHGTLNAPHMGLKTLENFPDVCDELLVHDNWLTSLAHCPAMITHLDVRHNQIHDFTHLSDSCEHIDATHNPFKSLKGLPEVPVSELEVSLSWDPNLPLLRLLNTTHVNVFHNHYILEPMNKIMNKYAGKGKSAMLNCALELKQAGYPGNAKW